MTQIKKSSKPFFSVLVAVRMFAGAAIALVLISLFLYGVDNPKPEWSEYWMIRPLIIVPLAGAVGGSFFYLMERQGYKGGIKILSTAISFIVYMIGLWMGFVLGLKGTLWD